MINYQIEQEALVAKDDATILWSNNFGGEVFKVLQTPNSTDCIVLLEPMSLSSNRNQNLICVSAAGGTIWKAATPNANDSFSEIRLIKQGLQANTWNGSVVKLNLADGTIVCDDFVK